MLSDPSTSRDPNESMSTGGSVPSAEAPMSLTRSPRDVTKKNGLRANEMNGIGMGSVFVLFTIDECRAFQSLRPSSVYEA